MHGFVEIMGLKVKWKLFFPTELLIQMANESNLDFGVVCNSIVHLMCLGMFGVRVAKMVKSVFGVECKHLFAVYAFEYRSYQD